MARYPVLTINKKRRTLYDLGEAGIIQLIKSKCPSKLPAYVCKGIGDDCAVLNMEDDKALLVTTDTLIESVHFTDQTLPPESLGWKALAVNVSDIAAMGGTPRTAFLSIGVKPDSEVSFLEAFMLGFQCFAEKTGVILAGGNTVESPSFVVITVTLLGDCSRHRVIYRSGARVGDEVWVTGQLGNAAAGLFLLRRESLALSHEHESLVQAHQKPEPPVELARALGESGLAHAMIDLSDGIGKDLRHICDESGVGALLQASALPVSDSLLELGKKVGISPLRWALHGGEDYQLLFTASPEDREKILSLANKGPYPLVTKIGTIIQDKGIWLQTAEGVSPLKSRGYLHFSK